MRGLLQCVLEFASNSLTFYTLTDLDKVSFLMKLPGADFIKNIIKPRIKVGREYVNQGRNIQQVKRIQRLQLHANNLYNKVYCKYFEN